MDRDTDFRFGNKISEYDYIYPTLNDLSEPIDFLLYYQEDYCENVTIPGLPELDPGNFPYNVEKVLWSHEGENDREDWLMIALNKDGNFIFFKAACDYTGFDCQGSMEIYVCKKYKDLINYALDEEDYRKYILETHKLPKNMNKEITNVKTLNFTYDKDEKERLFISHYLNYIPKRNSDKKPKIILEYSIGLEKYKNYGRDFMIYFIKENPYIYKIKLKDEEIFKTNKECHIDPEYDGCENNQEGFLINYKKGIEMKLKYKIWNFNQDDFTIKKFETILKE